MSDSDLSNLRTTLDEFALRGHTALLPDLQVTQNLFGFLTEEAAKKVGRTLNMLLG